MFRLVESAAAQLGFREDNYVIQSISPVPATTKEPAAPASAPALPQGSGSFLRFPELRRVRLNKSQTGARQTAIGAAGAAPTATQIVEAVRKAQAELETVGRPGPSGLLLHSRLFATLLDLAPGGAPYLQHVEHLIDSSEIAGTSALDGGKDGQKEGKRSNAADKESNAADKESNAADRVCGILFRLEPAAFDLVQTARPTVTVLERSSGQTGGQTSLRVEEDVVVRILDQLAIHHIVY